MKKLGIILDLIKVTHRLVPMLKYLGPSQATLYCRADQLAKNHRIVEDIKKLGTEIIVISDDDDKYGRPCAGHDVFYGEASFFYQVEIPEAVEDDFSVSLFRAKNKAASHLLARGKKIVCDTYSLELLPAEGLLQSGLFFLGASEEIVFRGVGAGEILCRADGEPEMGIAPGGGEIAAVGLPNATEAHLSLARRDRSCLKKELGDRMGVRFDPSLPLILYMTSHGLETSCLDRGLQRLARHANLIIKDRWPEYEGPDNGFNAPRPDIKGRNVHFYTDSDLNWLMRYAADVTLANPWSGGFYTNLMLGLRLIIIFTNKMRSGITIANLGVQPQNFTQILRDTRYLWVKTAYGLSPLNIEATEMIWDRIGDRQYWQRFDRDINRLAQGVMGRYWLGEEAARRGAMFIRRVLDRGTFRPEPAELENYRIIKGPVSYEFPTDIQL